MASISAAHLRDIGCPGKIAPHGAEVISTSFLLLLRGSDDDMASVEAWLCDNEFLNLSELKDAGDLARLPGGLIRFRSDTSFARAPAACMCQVRK